MNRNITLGIAAAIISLLVMMGAYQIGFSAGQSVDAAAKTDETNMNPNNMESMERNHPMIDVRKWNKKPSLKINVVKDKKAGYNLKINLKNFKFTPQNINKDNKHNQGHAHLYINGEKITRIYAVNHYIDASYLSEGANDVLVTLNANDHSELVRGSEHIEAKVRVTL